MEYIDIVKGDLKETKRMLESLSNYKTENLDVKTLIWVHCCKLEERIECLEKELEK